MEEILLISKNYLQVYTEWHKNLTIAMYCVIIRKLK